MTIHFITGNPNKFEEVRALLPQVERLEMDLLELQSANPQEIIIAKLQEAQKHHDGALMVEDTSLYFDCLNGLPGPFIKWFLEKMGREGLATLTEKLGNTTAEAITWLGYSDGNGETHFFQGTIRGTIVQPRGESGFGWDPIFQPEGSTETFAEMGRERKSLISARKQAVYHLKEFLKQQTP